MRTLLSVFSCFYLMCLAPVSAGEGLRWTQIPLHPDQPEIKDLGPLRWMGGLALTHDDPRFGGYSGLSVVADEGGALRLTAVSDTGHWIRGRLMLNAAGALRGIDALEVLPMRDLEGAVLAGKLDADAEGLRREGDHWLVSFERDHRIWRYRRDLTGPAEAVETPPEMAKLPSNRGVEAMAVRPEGGLVIISERGPDPQGGLQAWIRAGGRWWPARYRDTDEYLPTDAVTLPGGDLLVLERRFRPPLEVSARLRRVPGAALKRPGGEVALDGAVIAEIPYGYSVDNMEGLAVVPRPEGGAEIFLMSDDNKSPVQRTLLMHLRWPRLDAAVIPPP